MKRYPVSKARERLSDVLDEADRSGAVVVERRNVQYVITPRSGTRRTRRPQRPAIEILDRAVADGNWRWEWKPAGVEFRSRRKSR